MIIPKKNVQNEDRYKNTSSSESCIKVIIKDSKTGESVNAIFGNEQFARILAQKRGLIDKQGKIKRQEDYINFLNKDYLNYMIENEDEPINIDIDIEKLRKSKPNLIFDKPLTFEQLNVKNEQELLEKHFDFNYTKGHGILKKEYYEKYTSNPAFIALLIDLGYDVVWGDFVFNLNIYTEPFNSHFK